MNKPQIKSSKTVFHSSLFDVVQKDILFPNGKVGSWNTVIRPKTVVVFPITSKHELYLVKEYRVLFETTMLEAVAGHVEPEESVLRGAQRELQEETGITASQWEKLTTISLASSVVLSQVHLFLARELEKGSQQLEEDEIIEVVKMPLEEAVEKVMTGEIISSPTIVGIMMLDKLKREKRL